MYAISGGASNSMSDENRQFSLDKLNAPPPTTLSGQPTPLATPATSPVTATPNTDPNTSSNTTTTPATDTATQPTGTSPQYSENYKERMKQIKQAQLQRVNDAKAKTVAGIKSGEGDKAASWVRDKLSLALLAPYEVLNYTLISIMALKSKDRAKFIYVGMSVALACAIIFFLLWLLTFSVRYIIDVLGCLVAIGTLFFMKDLKLSSKINLGELQDVEDMYL